MQVRVVHRRGLQRGVGHRTTILLEGVEDGGVHLQWHLLRQSVVDHRRHLGHVSHLVALLLDNGRLGDDRVGISAANGRSRCKSLARGQVGEAPHHGGHELLGTGGGRDEITARGDEALELARPLGLER